MSKPGDGCLGCQIALMHPLVACCCAYAAWHITGSLVWAIVAGIFSVPALYLGVLFLMALVGEK